MTFSLINQFRFHFFIVWLIPIYASLAIVEFWYEIYIFFYQIGSNYFVKVSFQKCSSNCLSRIKDRLPWKGNPDRYAWLQKELGYKINWRKKVFVCFRFQLWLDTLSVKINNNILLLHTFHFPKEGIFGKHWPELKLVNLNIFTM